MGGESRTQAAMRKRVTHRHVPVYVLPKDIMRTATATPSTVSRNPYNMLRTFLSHDSNLPGLVSPRKNNSSIKTAYKSTHFFRDTKKSCDSPLTKLACNQIIFNFVKIRQSFYRNFYRPANLFWNPINCSISFFIIILYTVIILCIICPRLKNNNNVTIKKNIEKKMPMLNEYFLQVALKCESHHSIDTPVFFRERWKERKSDEKSPAYPFSFFLS